jgi:hypothetical protein
MTKKDFVALADHIKRHNKDYGRSGVVNQFTQGQIETLAEFCLCQNSRFKRQLWLDYIAGRCGPNGGKV